MRRRRTRRRRTYTRRMTAGRVRRIIGSELMFNDIFLASLSMPATTGQIIHLSSIPQGLTENDRSGNWIRPVTLYGTLNVEANQENAESVQPFRVMIVQWRENQNVDLITLDKVVQNAAEPFQGYDVQSKGAFKILWSWVSTVIGDVANPQLVKTRRFYVKPRTKILFDGDEPRKYHLFLVAFSDQALNAPFIYGNTRLRYTDS